MTNNRFFPFRRELGLQILAIYVVFVGFVVGGAFLFQRMASEQIESDVKAADLALAQAIAQETNDALDGAMQAVRRLANYPAVLQADKEGMRAVFSTLMSARNDVNLVYRLDEKGIMLYHYPEGPDSTVGVDFSFRDYFQAALNTRNPVASKGRISPTTDQPVATAVMPLWGDEGQFDGVVATNIKLQSLSHSLAAIAAEYPASDGFEIFMVDAAGQIIAHQDPGQLLTDANETIPSIAAAVLSGHSGNQIIGAGDGVERLYSFVPIHSVGWGAVVGRPTDVAFASLQDFQRGAVIAIAIFLLGGLIFWLALSRQMIFPLERLADFSRQFGIAQRASSSQQKVVSDLASRPDQIGYLTRSLTDMQTAIEARLNELETLLQTSAAVVSTLDPPEVLDRILEQVERLMDVQMCAIFAFDQSQGKFRVRASRGLSSWYIEHAIIDPNEPGSVTMRAIRSGEPIQISDTETNPSFTAHRQRARIAGYRSVMAVPLNAKHTPPAALLVYRPDSHVFTRREIDLLSSFANHAAMAIENAALYARSDMRLQEQTHRLESLIQSMQDGLILEDLEGSVLYANRRIEELAGHTQDVITGVPAGELMDLILARAEDAEAARKAVDEALSGQSSRPTYFTLLLNNQLRHMRIRVFDVSDPAGMRIGRGRLLRDITERFEVERMKSSLISTVSHELRTPLAAIKGYATTLLAEDVQWDRDSQQEFLSIISLEADHLSDLVDDLLDMSRIESGNLTVSRTLCNLDELVERAASRAYSRPGNRLQVDIPADLPPLYADPQRIEVVIRNLIENAAKYSDDDRPIWVTANRENGALIVRVIDEGPGIAEEQQQRVFDSFYRVEDGLRRKTAGAGLGLSISKGFIQAHGGNIWLESRQQGTCVAFSLPLADEQGGVDR